MLILQKYRIYLRRLGGVSQHQGSLNNSFMTSQDASFGSLPTLNGFDLQALAQLPAQSLAQLQAAGLGRPAAMNSKPGLPVSSSIVDERSVFSFDNPKMSLLHGVPTGMEPRQLAGLQQHRMTIQQQIAAVRAGHSLQNNGMRMPLASQQQQPFSRPQQSSIRQPMLPNRSGFSGRSSIPESSRVLPTTSYTNLATQQQHSMAFSNFQQELPLNSFPLASAPGLSVRKQHSSSSSYREEVNSSEAGFATPSYDMFSSRQNDWDLRSMLSPHQDSQAYSSSSVSRNNNSAVAATDHSRNHHQQTPQGMVSHHQVYGNGGGSSVKVKSETMGFHEQYSNQEDLMSALLKQV